MEDDKFKSLFSDFNPELPSDFEFMHKLERNLNSVEMVKQRVSETRTRSRKAVILAAFAGFIVGFLFSLALPYLNVIVADWQPTLPAESMLNALAEHFTLIAWTAIGATSVFAALNTYELSLSLLKPKE